MPDNSQGVIELFTEASKLPIEERTGFLDRVCADEGGLRQKVEALLRSHDRVEGFLEEPATTISKGRTKVAAGEKPGDQVDRYQLLQQIGEGGCGVVFAAEQQSPVMRRVALKLIKPGMDTKSVIARFEAERQVLALMDHPNIAHVLDAGATASGHPYFVMELVRGPKITDFCDQKSLSTKRRLELFIQVCGAVQHAHQKGIIHRDLKPSNILITTDVDGNPAPKVIDFGIAKATSGQRLTDKTLFTSFDMFIGTPAYMSPEQAELTSIDVDTRSDIYSLGVLLYELLTGTTPFEMQELIKAGLDEVRRVIRTVDPTRPSVRLCKMTADELAIIAQRHSAEAAGLIRETRGDLDWIVMKAMEKDRARRYATANGLALDVERFLHQEAVLARPASAPYKLHKLFQRNKVLFIGLTSFFLLLVIALAVAVRLLVVQRRAVHLASALDWESRATDYMDDGQLEKAEAAFEQSLEIRRRYLGNEPPPPGTTKLVTDFLITQGRPGDAVWLLSQIVTPLDLGRSEYYTIFYDYCSGIAAEENWKDATVLATLLVEKQPYESNGYHTLAPLLVATTNLVAYQELCAKIMATFSHTTNYLVADRMAKDCLILPLANVNLNAVAGMANLAVMEGKATRAYPFLVCTAALAQYRLGNFQAAIDWTQKCSGEVYNEAKAEALAINAMALYKSGNIEVARQAMKDCNSYIARFLPDSQLPGNDWRDWIIAHALQREADGLMNPKSQ